MSSSKSKLKGLKSIQLERTNNSSSTKDRRSSIEENDRTMGNQPKEPSPGPEITKPIDTMEQMRERIRRRDRKANELEPEIHIVGEIDSGSGFIRGGVNGGDSSGACVKWMFDFGECWEHLGGHMKGQSHVDYPNQLFNVGDGVDCVWCHPIDLHLSSKGIAGWPRLLVQVWRMDEHGRLELSGYGYCQIPNVPGHHELDIPTWRPLGTLSEELAAEYLGGTPQLRDLDLIFKKAWSDRCRLNTAASGVVRVNVDVVMRHFATHGIDL